MRYTAVTVLLLAAAAVLFAAQPPGKVGIPGVWITVNDAIGGNPESVFVTTAKDARAFAGIPIVGTDESLESLYCMAFPSGLPSGAYCGERCAGVVAPRSGQCCWICPGECTHAYLAACPGTSGGSGPGMCKGRICTK